MQLHIRAVRTGVAFLARNDRHGKSVNMDIDFSAHPNGAHYAAYLDHLLHCTECGRARCPVGADLYARYLDTAVRLRRRREEALR
ncbi:hypothetical protein STENM223S_10389 [Streptomyces tendae]